MIAHAIDSQTPRFRGRIDDVAARAHAEGVYAPSIGTLMGHLIIGRPQRFDLCSAVLCGIDVSLRMLNAQSDGERFLLYGHASLQQPLKGITRAVSHGQNGDIRLKFFRSVYRDSLQRSVLNPKIGDAALEVKGSSQTDDLFPHIFHDDTEHIGSDMGLILIKNGWIRSELHEHLQHFSVPHQRVFHQRVEFPIGKCSRAAFSKLYVGVALQLSALPELKHRPFSLFHPLSPLEYDRAKAGSCQHQCTEKAGRTASYDDGTVL